MFICWHWILNIVHCQLFSWKIGGVFVASSEALRVTHSKQHMPWCMPFAMFCRLRNHVPRTENSLYNMHLLHQTIHYSTYTTASFHNLKSQNFMVSNPRSQNIESHSKRWQFQYVSCVKLCLSEFKSPASRSTTEHDVLSISICDPGDSNIG